MRVDPVARRRADRLGQAFEPAIRDLGGAAAGRADHVVMMAGRSQATKACSPDGRSSRSMGPRSARTSSDRKTVARVTRGHGGRGWLDEELVGREVTQLRDAISPASARRGAVSRYPAPSKALDDRFSVDHGPRLAVIATQSQ